MTKPTLYIFAISHFCEKARWAMDRSGIDYKVKNVAPGVHIQIAKKLGLSRTSVPFLQTSDGAIQGSDEIIDWIEQQTGVDPMSKSDKAIEKRLGDRLGVHLRRYYYSEAILDHPDTVKPIFKKGLSIPHKLLVNSIWKKVCGLMVKGMDLGPEQRLESKAIVEKELDWLDGLLAKNTNYLSGDTFTRLDLTAASLLAPAVSPREHPTYSNLQLPPILAAEVNEYIDRPCFAWVSKMYREHR